MRFLEREKQPVHGAAEFITQVDRLMYEELRGQKFISETGRVTELTPGMEGVERLYLVVAMPSGVDIRKMSPAYGALGMKPAFIIERGVIFGGKDRWIRIERCAYEDRETLRGREIDDSEIRISESDGWIRLLSHRCDRERLSREDVEEVEEYWKQLAVSWAVLGISFFIGGERYVPVNRDTALTFWPDRQMKYQGEKTELVPGWRR